MPQNKPMKRQFTTIDGRTVMSNLPQHWGGNDWKITGVDNPLPVGNYVQTEAGVWIPQKGSDDGAADVRLTGSTVEEVIFPRQIRTSNSPLIIRERPKNAVGLFVEHIVYGRTGIFESGEGHSIIAMPYNSTPGRALVGGIKDFTTERSFQFTSIDYSFSISLLPYKSFENQTNVSVVVPPIYKSVRFQILISGSFDDGEGIDSELIAHWILK